jgi:CTP synthase (UTP-ammonia lyase)
MPYIETAGELKTKPTQHSVKELRGFLLRRLGIRLGEATRGPNSERPAIAARLRHSEI